MTAAASPGMRVVILTSGMSGVASLCTAALAEDPAIAVAAIVCSIGVDANPWRRRRRQLRKLVSIGPLGILNSRRIGPWFNTHVNERLDAERLDLFAARKGIPLHYTPRINCDETVEHFRDARADLAIALGGNPYIGEAIYSVPRYGMLNVHAELLPEFRGANSVIWQIHEGSTNTGYTVHEIDKRIDTGRIIFRETIPIEFMSTLSETVTHNCVRIARAAARSLPQVVRSYVEIAAVAPAQGAGRFFTTPTLRQYLKMLRQHKALSARATQG
jgi:methionyl-tRNA formyltransferase